MVAAGTLIKVALPVPLFRTFIYAVDREWANPVVPGARVVVPLRGGSEIGVCMQVGVENPPAVSLKAVLDVPDAEPALSAPLLAVCQWIGRYYLAPIGLVVRSALPALLTGADAPRPAPRAQRVATVQHASPSLLARDALFARAPRQRAVFELLESLGGRAPVAHLTRQLGVSPSVVQALVARGVIAIEDQVIARDPFAVRATPPAADHAPTPAQTAAIAAIETAAPGTAFLLHGVTGSGKTLVYIEALRRIVGERGRSAIVLVPEIALTPQTVDRFRAVFGDQVAVLHSALSDGERYDAWRALRRGEKRIAIGARSAVFAPLENVGAIIVDEEHEPSYKQGETPRYHARDVAIVRARSEGAVVILGSATPSLESWHNATTGRFQMLTLPARVGGSTLPAVDIVDLRGAGDRTSDRARSDAAGTAPGAGHVFRRVISERLEEALARTLADGGQSILLLNRRGYASFLQCSACGDVVTCPNCSITLTWHQAPERLVCHYCLHEAPAAQSCLQCGGETLRQRGVGTQQVERLLAERYPAARIARMDMDTTSGKWAHADILDRVGRGDVDILLGTQMIAKGLDFPNVTLVGVVDADVGINLPDFRASERCFQLLSQVAGRAGRGHKGGRVIIQTRAPGHHAVECAVTHDYLSFVRDEMAGRSEPRYPPFVRLANVLVSGLAEEATAEFAIRIADWLRPRFAASGSGITLVGPAPCAVERVKTRWRWHLLLKSADSPELTRAARSILSEFGGGATHGVRVTVDRDPATLL